MTDDDKLRDLLERAVDSLGFVFKQTPKAMYKVLNDTENFDDLIVMCIAAADMRLPVDIAYELYKEEKELMEKRKAEVIELWKKRKVSVESADTSIIRITRRKKNTTKPGT